MTRRGKIARLPLSVRDELNQRIENGEQGTHLVAWLNGHPDVKRVLAEYFEGHEINEPNLSDWKAGGYEEWLARKEMVRRMEERSNLSDRIAGVTEGSPAHDLAMVLTTRYGVMLDEWNGEVTDEFERKLRALGWLCRDIARLRRGEHEGFRVAVAMERAEWEGEDHESKKEKEEAFIKRRIRRMQEESAAAMAADQNPKPQTDAASQADEEKGGAEEGGPEGEQS